MGVKSRGEKTGGKKSGGGGGIKKRGVKSRVTDCTGCVIFILNS